MSNITLKLFESSEKKLFAIDEAGRLLLFDGARFRVLTKTVSQIKVKSITETSNGKLLVATDKNEVFEVKGEDFNFILRVNQQNLTGITSTKDGSIYLKCSKGLFNYNDGLLSPISEFDEMTVYDVKADLENNLWVSTSTGLYKTTDDETEMVNVPDLSFNSDTKIFVDHRNTIWVYNDNGILYSAQSDFAQLSEEHGLSSVNVRVMFEDKEKNLWAGTNNNGLNKLRYKLFRCISQEDGLLADGVAPLLKLSDQTILVGNNCGGINRFIYGKIFKSKIPENNCVWSLMEDEKKNIWIGTYGGGLYIYNADKEVYRFNKENNFQAESVFALLNDKNGTVWAGTDVGLFVINKKNYSVTRFKPEIFNSKINYFLQDTKSVIWVGTNNGLFKINGGEISAFNTYNGLPSNTIRTIFEDADENVWIGTVGGGLCKFKNNTLHVFSDLLNVLGPDIFCLALDEDNRFWITSNKGMYEVSRKELLDHSVNSEVSVNSNFYGRRDGLKTNEFNSGFQPNVLNETGKQIWFPTIKGVAILNKYRYTKNDYTPSIFIEKILVDNEEKKTDSALSLTRDVKSIEFFFTAPRFHQPDKVYYEYKLEGLNNEWSLATNDRFARFASVKPGNYIFKVRLFSKPETEKKISIIIPVPIWQKQWFVAFSYAGFILLLSLIMYLRIRHVRKREIARAEVNKNFAELELKALQSQMNPHFIFNCLNTIKYFITTNNHQSANKYLGKFSKLLRMFLDQSKSVTITLEQEINLLRLYIELEQMRFSEGFNFHLQVESDLDYRNIELPGTLFQPYVENAINHGLINLKRKGNLSITFKEDNGILIGTIDDDGIGRDESKKLKSQSTLNHTSHGMKLIEDRIKTINFIKNSTIETQITDKRDKDNKPIGTQIIIKIPLQKN